ncbi:MAG: hypothetical protein E4G99_01060 [Anaerolineales bacterium]|nr:MAG: hypothetical protein E4G99_01060 [Anaerolineales bacterium]
MTVDTRQNLDMAAQVIEMDVSVCASIDHANLASAPYRLPCEEPSMQSGMAHDALLDAAGTAHLAGFAAGTTSVSTTDPVRVTSGAEKSSILRAQDPEPTAR